MKKQIISLFSFITVMISVATAQPSTNKPTVPIPNIPAVKNKPSIVEEGNVVGWNREIHYIDGNHTHWILKANKTSGSIISTGDPIWAASSDNRKTWKFLEWITILDDRGGLWQSKMHAHTSNGSVLVYLENKHNGDSNGKNGPIDILDWHGRKWQIASVGILPDGFVKFNLNK